MKTKTESATKPEQDKNDEAGTDKKSLNCDVTIIEGDEDRNLSLAERKGIVGLVDMDDNLFEVYERIVPLVNRQRGSDAEVKYEIGVHVNHVLMNENGYGRKAVVSLAEALDFDQSTIRDYARVTRAWEREEFSELMNRKGRQGLRLSLSHLIEIAIRSDPKERRWWIDEVLKEGWPVKELRRQIKPAPVITEATAAPEEVSDEDAVSEIDATHPTPTRIRQTIVRLNAEVESIPMMSPEWNAFVYEPLSSDPGLYGDDVFDELRESSEAHAVAIKSLQDNKQQLDELITLEPQSEQQPSAGQSKEGGEQDV